MSDSEQLHNTRTNFKSPLAMMAGSFALGVAAARPISGVASAAWFPTLAATALLVGLLLLRRNCYRLAILLLLAAMLLTGVAVTWQRAHRFPLEHVRYLQSRGVEVNSPLRVEGRVISTPTRSGAAWQFDMEVLRLDLPNGLQAISGKIRLRAPHAEPLGAGGAREIRYGDLIGASVRLNRPRTYQNPGSFDYRRWMDDIEDIYWVGSVRSGRSIEMLGHPPDFSIPALAEHARQRLLRGIDDLYPPWSAQARYGSVLKAVLWGDRTALDSATIDDFRKTGLYHLLVIAGLHVGLLTLLAEFLLRALGFRRVSRAVIVLAFLAVYACLVEQRAATLRATLMIALYLLARILDRGHSALNAIGGVALALLYIRPAWLFESGFQLSFAAALLIVTIAVPILERSTEPYRRALWRLDDVLLDDRFSPRLAQTRLDLRSIMVGLRRRVALLHARPGLVRYIVVTPLKLAVWLVSIVIFSAVLQLGLLLPMVETFHRVTFAGVGLNALAIPVMTLLLALALPINLLSVASPAIAVWPAKVLTLVMTLLFNMTHLPNLEPWLSYRIPAPPVWVAWGFCGAFVMAACTLRYARRAAAVATGICLVFVVLVALDPFEPRLPHGLLEVTALDCGEGQAIFIVLPSGATMLLDAGGNPGRSPHQTNSQVSRWDSGEEIVAPYLWSRGIKRIDVVALTQPNFEGIPTVLNNFAVGEFWHAPFPPSDDYAVLLKKLAEHSVPTRTLIPGDALAFGGARLLVVPPGASQVTFSAATPPLLAPGLEDARALSRGRGVSELPAFKPGATLLDSGDGALALQLSVRGRDFLLAGNMGMGVHGATTLEWDGTQLSTHAYRMQEAEGSGQWTVGSRR